MIGRFYTSLIAPPIVEKNSKDVIIIQAIAARDRTRAEAFAKKHGIPEVKDTYQQILDDPNIDAVSIPLPNSLHFEWAVRSIRAGKHVLVEKPCVNTHAEAEYLFNLPELTSCWRRDTTASTRACTGSCPLSPCLKW